MKALSILQPYAWLIVTGRKDIENRSWYTGFRGELLIHSGKRYARRDHAEDGDAWGDPYPDFGDMGLGCVVGVARVVDCVQASSSRWFQGPWGFVLEGARPLQHIPLRGQLGIFDVPDDIVAQALGR